MRLVIIKVDRQTRINMMSVICICALMSGLIPFCYGKGGVYTIEKTIDSLETEIQLDNIINGLYISVDLNNRNFYRGLHENRDFSIRDLRYLPYICLALNEKCFPYEIISTYRCMLGHMCNFSPNDSVYKLGKVYSIESKDRYYKITKPDSIRPWWDFDDERDPSFLRKPPIVQIDNVAYNLDSLRVSVIGYNDRSALTLLEKYYKDIDMGKELAVYYKVMLGFEGNGDLAERYYEVLKPYLAKQPEFYNSIRETLLRAALCDGNARAQELCDSLGFSLCDYRMPILGVEAIDVKNFND